MAKKLAKEHMRTIGKKGGKALVKRKGRDYMKELGRKGGNKSWLAREKKPAVIQSKAPINRR